MDKKIIPFIFLLAALFSTAEAQVSFPNDTSIKIHMGQNPSSSSHLIATDVPEVTFNTYYIY